MPKTIDQNKKETNRAKGAKASLAFVFKGGSMKKFFAILLFVLLFSGIVRGENTYVGLGITYAPIYSDNVLNYPEYKGITLNFMKDDWKVNAFFLNPDTLPYRYENTIRVVEANKTTRNIISFEFGKCIDLYEGISVSIEGGIGIEEMWGWFFDNESKYKLIPYVGIGVGYKIKNIGFISISYDQVKNMSISFLIKVN